MTKPNRLHTHQIAQLYNWIKDTKPNFALRDEENAKLASNALGFAVNVTNFGSMRRKMGLRKQTIRGTGKTAKNKAQLKDIQDLITSVRIIAGGLSELYDKLGSTVPTNLRLITHP
jgi:hypothetical protein